MAVSFRRHTQFFYTKLSVVKVKYNLGVLDTISQKYESLDYDTNFNSLLLDEVRSRGYKFVVRKDVLRWVVMFFVGILTALVACCIDISVEEGSKIKYGFLSWLTEKERLCDQQNVIGQTT